MVFRRCVGVDFVKMDSRRVEFVYMQQGLAKIVQSETEVR